MANLALIPCAGSKNATNVVPVTPIGNPCITAHLGNPIIIANLIAKRNLLMPVANIIPGGFSPANDRYRGPHALLYKNTAPANWVIRPNPANHVLIVSGLYGLLKYDTFIPNYNLAMSDYFGALRIHNFWSAGGFLRSVLIDYCNNNNITHIFDLLTTDYRNALNLAIGGLPGVGITRPVPIGPRGVLHLKGLWLDAYL